MTTTKILQNAKAVQTIAAKLTFDEKTQLLNAMAQALLDNEQDILQANQKDTAAAKDTLGDVMIDRLMLNSQRIKGMAQGILDVAKLPCPSGELVPVNHLENGLIINKMTVPMGVIAIIYESRPNVTADAAALCIKSGNVCILRGGKEAFASNNAIVNALRAGIKSCNQNQNLISLVQDTTRQSASELMQARGFVDLLIPRGGAGLIKACVENAIVPCIETGTGICHVYVDKQADLDMAANILYNAKTSRPSVCNAAEVCLVHKDIAEEFLPKAAILLEKMNVELRLCKRSAKIICGNPANLHDFDTEFLDYILSVKIVDNIQEAINHISAHSTGHSDAIITNDTSAANEFCKCVDSAAVYVNASTRFTDGSVFGLGCEMGISTQKLGARGPMGISELMTYKYVIMGNGQTR